MSAFAIGDRVVARFSTQGLRAGVTYRVADAHRQVLPFGTFVTYLLADDDGTTFYVANLHCIARPAEPAQEAR